MRPYSGASCTRIALLIVSLDLLALSLLPRPPAAASPDGAADLPDLAPLHMRIEFESGSSCDWQNSRLGLRALVANQGSASAGPFVVDLNDGQVQETVASLAAGAQTELFFPRYSYPGANLLVVDIHDEVAESNEENNILDAMVPIPTAPATCTATPSPTVTCPCFTETATLSHTATPSCTRTPRPTATATFSPTPTARGSDTPTRSATPSTPEAGTATPTPTTGSAQRMYLPVLLRGE